MGLVKADTLVPPQDKLRQLYLLALLSRWYHFGGRKCAPRSSREYFFCILGANGAEIMI